MPPHILVIFHCYYASSFPHSLKIKTYGVKGIDYIQTNVSRGLFYTSLTFFILAGKIYTTYPHVPLFPHCKLSPFFSYFCIFPTGRMDPTRFNASDQMRSMQVGFESLLEDEENQVRGFTYIFDEKELGLAIITLWTPSEVSKAFQCCEVKITIPQCCKGWYDSLFLKLKVRLRFFVVLFSTVFIYSVCRSLVISLHFSFHQLVRQSVLSIYLFD